MSSLRSSELYQMLLAYPCIRWMPCQSWAFLRWPCFKSFLRLLVMVLLWSMLAEIRFIPSSSMYPTLRVSDRIIMEKASLLIRNAAQNDIVLFRPPSQIGFKEEDILIKRIVAIGGDVVEVDHGMLYVNGVAQDEDFIAEPPKCTIPKSLAFGIRYEPHMYVPKGHVYVLGDNRNNSCDSHVWGPLPIKSIVGKLYTCLRPSTIGSFRNGRLGRFLWACLKTIA